MSANGLALEVEGIADLIADLRAMLQIIAQQPDWIDRETAARLAEILQRAEKPLRDFSRELHSLSLALAEAPSEREH